MCQAEIKGSLLNPETAQFFEFEPLDRRSLVNGMEEYVWSRTQVPRSERHLYAGQLDAEVSERVTDFVRGDARAYSYRVKAISRVGDTITARFICAIDTDCSCLATGE